MFGNKTEETPFMGQRWEYKTVMLPAVNGAMKDQAGRFNDLGEQGWEFQAVLIGEKLQQAVFKRPVISE